MKTYTSPRVCVKGDSWNGWRIQVKHTPGARLFAPPPAAVPIGRYSPARRMVVEDDRRERRRKSRVLAFGAAVAGALAVVFGGRW